MLFKLYTIIKLTLLNMFINYYFAAFCQFYKLLSLSFLFWNIVFTYFRFIVKILFFCSIDNFIQNEKIEKLPI